MSSVSSSKSKKLLLLLILWLLPAQACASATNTPAPPSTSPEYKAIELVNLCDELNDGKLKECDLVVIVKSLTQTLNVNIVAQATAGILFKEYVQGELDTNRRKIVISLSLAPNEERRLILPYEVDETVLFSGEYVIKVDAVESKNSVLFSNRTKAFVRVQAGQKPELLPTQQEFDNHFSNSFHYIYSNIELSTNDKLSVLIQLQDIPEPTEGQVLVKVVSDEDNYNPTIEMQISGGILFEETSLIEVNNSQYVALNSPGIIQATGSRILVFPFHLDTQSVDGTYSIVIISKDETGIVREDISSLGIEKFSSTVKDELAWLTTITFNLLPTPTPLPTSP